MGTGIPLPQREIPSFFFCFHLLLLLMNTAGTSTSSHRERFHRIAREREKVDLFFYVFLFF
jgi:hypothetical protein